MTLDDLLNIGNEASDDVAAKAERMGLCPSGVEMGRARVKAIVEALRDEMEAKTWERRDAIKLLDEILGAGFAVDEAAGGGSGKQSTQMLPTPAADHPSYTDYMNETVPMKVGPAAAPVCVWTRIDEDVLESGCDPDGWTYNPEIKRDTCPQCGKPISFKSEAAR